MSQQELNILSRQSGMTRSSANTLNTHNPSDKHVQPWYPSPSNFHGRSVASESYKKWDLPRREVEEKDPRDEYHPIPFKGSTTSADAHRAFPIEHREPPKRQEYVPNKAAFYGDTTSKSSYKEWELPPRDATHGVQPEYKPLPFRGRSTAQDAFQGHQLDPSETVAAVRPDPRSKFQNSSGKFYGETTSASSYRQWEIPRNEVVDREPVPYQSLPFRGTTTTQDTYQGLMPTESVQSARVQSNASSFQPNNAKFYGETTSGQSYQKWELPKQTTTARDVPQYKPIPFSGTSTSQDTYREFPVEVKPPAQPIKYQPNKAYFYGSTTYGETFKAYELPRSSADEQIPQTPPHTPIPFRGSTTFQDSYKAHQIERQIPSESARRNSLDSNRSIKFSGTSESQAQYKAYSAKELQDALPGIERRGSDNYQPLPFRGTSTSQESFQGWQLPRQRQSVGIEIVGDGYYVMLPHSRVLPTKATHVFTTVTDDQAEVEIKILQGEGSKASQCSVLGEFELVGISKGPCGSPQIAVTLSINEDNVLHVDAVDRLTGVEHHMAIDREKNLSAFSAPSQD